MLHGTYCSEASTIRLTMNISISSLSDGQTFKSLGFLSLNSHPRRLPIKGASSASLKNLVAANSLNVGASQYELIWCKQFISETAITPLAEKVYKIRLKDKINKQQLKMEKIVKTRLRKFNLDTRC